MVNLSTEKQEILKRTEPDNDANMEAKAKNDKSSKNSKEQGEISTKRGAEKHPLPGQSPTNEHVSTVIKDGTLNSGAEVHHPGRSNQCRIQSTTNKRPKRQNNLRTI